MVHQYIERESGAVRTEQLYGDRLVRLVYNQVRENAPLFFKLCTSARMSSLLGFVNYDAPLVSPLAGNRRFAQECGIDFAETVELPEYFTTPRRVFERQIRYWDCRPMPEGRDVVVSPADARVLVGSFRHCSQLFLKEKFFEFEEFLGADKREWLRAFAGGDFAVFRLTPDKYHYNHVPVSGKVVDLYEIGGVYHSCNPGAVVEVVTPYSKNKRVVTIIDTDLPGGSCVGLVAMVEVVALMIGEVVQSYSKERYENPVALQPGMFLEKGATKSLYRPGSSTDVLIFQEGRVAFADDLLRNRNAHNVTSRFSAGFGAPLVETDVKVRSLIAEAAKSDCRL
jgi:phosphatidylserine decarboxylase